MLGPSIHNHRRTGAGAATPLATAASKLLRLRTNRTRTRQVPGAAHGSMKHICVKSLQVGQVPATKVPVARLIVTWKTEDSFADFEPRKAHFGARGHDLFCGGSVACRPGHPTKPGSGTSQSFSFC